MDLVLLYRRKLTMSTLKTKIEEIEKGELLRALAECSWVMARAAKKLGITERIISYKIKKYGIKKQVSPK